MTKLNVKGLKIQLANELKKVWSRSLYRDAWVGADNGEVFLKVSKYRSYWVVDCYANDNIEYSICVWGYHTPSQLADAILKGLQAEHKFQSKINLEKLMKKALRLCNTKNPRVKIDYFSNAVMIEDGRFYLAELSIHYSNGYNLWGEGCSKKSEFVDYVNKLAGYLRKSGALGVHLFSQNMNTFANGKLEIKI